MTIKEMEETYQRLRDQLLNGDLDEERFRAVVDLLHFEDKLGYEWKIGWHTGKWYRYDQGQWIQGTPVEGKRRKDRTDTARQQRATSAARRFSSTPCLVVMLVGLLLAASALLIFAWNVDWWQKSPEGTTAAAAATQVEEATVAPSATATSKPTASATASITPSTTPSHTATRRATATLTPTAEHTQTSTPMSSPTPRATSGTTSTASIRPTATPSLSGRIYFPVYDPNPDRRTFDIYVFDLDDGVREIMLGQASQPALSPNGARLAYRSWDINSRGLRVRELSDGSTWSWISFHEAEHPSWSPDNLNVTFSSQQESDRKWRLYRTLGLETIRVTRDGGDIFGRVPNWAADGQIIYWECPLGNCGLHAIHPDGTGSVRLTDSEYDTAPAVSPDGSRVVFMSNRGGNWEVYLVGTYETGTQQQQRRLTDNAARDGLPTWSPDGSWIAFASDRGGSWAVWAMRPDGSGQHELFALGGPLLGEVANVPPTEQHGWTSEALAWGK